MMYGTDERHHDLINRATLNRQEEKELKMIETREAMSGRIYLKPEWTEHHIVVENVLKTHDNFVVRKDGIPKIHVLTKDAAFIFADELAKAADLEKRFKQCCEQRGYQYEQIGDDLVLTNAAGTGFNFKELKEVVDFIKF